MSEMEDDDASCSTGRSSSSTINTQDGSSSSGSCSLDDSIGRMLRRLEKDDSSLVDIDVDCKLMDADAARCMSLVLQENTHLKRLRLDCGNDSSRLDVIRRIVSGLKGNSSVSGIEIHDLTMDRDTSSWMAHSLATSKSLKHLSMTKCRFLGSGLGVLFVAMQPNKRIRHLAFRCCDWDEHNTDIVATSLPLLNLLSLSLVGINIAVDSWPYLLQNIKLSKELILLDLSWNNIDDAIISLLTKTMMVQQKISTLVLSSCGLDDTCTKELTKGLRKYSTLTSLDLSKNNKMSSKGVVYLQDLMKFNSFITELKVNDCGLNDSSLNEIENSLRYNNSVLKSFLSEAASQAIFEMVDTIGKFDIGESTRNIVEAVSFGSGSETSHSEEAATRILAKPRKGRMTNEKNYEKNRMHGGRTSALIKKADQTTSEQGSDGFTKGKEVIRYTMKSTTPNGRHELFL